MTDSQFTNADPWGLPLDEGADTDEEDSTPEEQPDSGELQNEMISEPAQETADTDVESSDPIAIVAGESQAEPIHAADPEATPLPDETRQAGQPAANGIGEGQADGSAGRGEGDNSETDTATEVKGDQDTVESGDEVEPEVEDHAPLFAKSSEKFGTPDLEALADELASTLPAAVDEPIEKPGPTDLEELSNKVSAWNDGGISPHDQGSDSSLIDETGYGFLSEATTEDPGQAELAGQDESGLSHQPAPADDGQPEEVKDSADPDGSSLSWMAASADEVVSDEDENGVGSLVEELPDELPSWAVDDDAIFGDSVGADPPGEPDQTASTQEAGTATHDQSAGDQTADPFGAGPTDQVADAVEAANDLFTTETNEPGTDGQDDPSGPVVEGVAEVGENSELESLEALVEDLAAATTDPSIDETPNDGSHDEADGSPADQFAPEPRSTASYAPGGVAGAAAAFFKRGDTQDAAADQAEPADDDEDPPTELGSWVDEEAGEALDGRESDGHDGSSGDSDHDSGDPFSWTTDSLVSTAHAPSSVPEPASASDSADDSGEEIEAVETAPHNDPITDDPTLKDQESAVGEAIDADDESEPETDSAQIDLPEPKTELGSEAGADDPWTTLTEDEDLPSGLDRALGDQQVPSVYAELEELPPALPIESDDPPAPTGSDGRPDGGEPDTPAGPSAAKDDWGSLWSDSAQGWVEDADGGSQWRTIVTSADSLSAWQVDTYLGMVSGDAEVGDGPIGEMLPLARQAALEKMVADALTRAAHAVVAVNVSITTIRDSTLVTASGTAATLRTED